MTTGVAKWHVLYLCLTRKMDKSCQNINSHLYFTNGWTTAMYLSVDIARVLNIEPIQNSVEPLESLFQTLNKITLTIPT